MSQHISLSLEGWPLNQTSVPCSSTPAPRSIGEQWCDGVGRAKQVGRAMGDGVFMGCCHSWMSRGLFQDSACQGGPPATIKGQPCHQAKAFPVPHT